MDHENDIHYDGACAPEKKKQKSTLPSWLDNGNLAESSLGDKPRLLTESYENGVVWNQT